MTWRYWEWRYQFWYWVEKRATHQRDRAMVHFLRTAPRRTP